MWSATKERTRVLPSTRWWTSKRRCPLSASRQPVSAHVFPKSAFSSWLTVDGKLQVENKAAPSGSAFDRKVLIPKNVQPRMANKNNEVFWMTSGMNMKMPTGVLETRSRNTIQLDADRIKQEDPLIETNNSISHYFQNSSFQSFWCIIRSRTCFYRHLDAFAKQFGWKP